MKTLCTKNLILVALLSVSCAYVFSSVVAEATVSVACIYKCQERAICNQADEACFACDPPGPSETCSDSIFID